MGDKVTAGEEVTLRYKPADLVVTGTVVEDFVFDAYGDTALLKLSRVSGDCPLNEGVFNMNIWEKVNA